MPMQRTSTVDWGDQFSEALEEVQDEFRLCGREPMSFGSRRGVVYSDESDVASLIGLFGKEIGERLDTGLRLSLLEKVILELRHVVAELLRQRTFQVSITSLGTDDLALRQPLTAVVEAAEDHFVATFFDANINASGDTAVEAIDNLKEIIVSAFRRFQELGEERLGPGPRKQFANLRNFIQSPD